MLRFQKILGCEKQLIGQNLERYLFVSFFMIHVFPIVMVFIDGRGAYSSSSLIIGSVFYLLFSAISMVIFSVLFIIPRFRSSSYLVLTSIYAVIWSGVATGGFGLW